MKVLFVYPNVTRAKSPQLGICMLAGITQQLGHECDLYDLTIIPDGEEIPTFQSKLEEFDPNLVAISCRSNEWVFLKELFQSVNLNKTLVVFGGPHATVSPDEVIKIGDIVVLGEGEETFSELLQKISNKKDISNIKGCWVKQEGKIMKNEMRNLISNLDDLPFPYWKIFDDIHYYGSYIKRLFKGANVVGTFECSRGCPYACTYCTNDYVRRLYKGKGKWRREKSPERIIRELQLFRDEYGLDCVYFIDEVVLTHVNRLEKFRDLYRPEIGVPFVFMERPENITDKKVSIIKQAGAKIVSIGIESGDENLRKTLLNRKHSQETIILAFQIAKRHGLITHAFTMIGFPGEDIKSYKETFKLLRKARPNTVQTTIFFPLKGTQIFEKVVKERFFDPNTPMPQNYYEKSSLNFSKRKQKELLRYQYLFSHYNSKLLFHGYLPKILLTIAMFSPYVLNKLRKEGFLSTLKAIWRKIV